MQYILVVAFVAALAGTSEASKCEDIANCTPDPTKLQVQDQPSKVTQEACKAIRDSVKCYRETIVDCRTKSNITKDVIGQLETQIGTLQQMLDGSCTDGSQSGQDNTAGGSSGSSGVNRLGPFSAATTLSLLVCIFALLF